MIPIRDGRGSTVGFGARALDKDATPKYLNSPQGPLFDKSRLLFGLDMARRAIRETETVVIVEGYMDAIQAHQAGFTNVVAQMGTALTEEQLRQLDRYATPPDPGPGPRCRRGERHHARFERRPTNPRRRTSW